MRSEKAYKWCLFQVRVLYGVCVVRVQVPTDQFFFAGFASTKSKGRLWFVRSHGKSKTARWCFMNRRTRIYWHHWPMCKKVYGEMLSWFSPREVTKNLWGHFYLVRRLNFLWCLTRMQKTNWWWICVMLRPLFKKWQWSGVRGKTDLTILLETLPVKQAPPWPAKLTGEKKKLSL